MLEEIRGAVGLESPFENLRNAGLQVRMRQCLLQVLWPLWSRFCCDGNKACHRVQYVETVSHAWRMGAEVGPFSGAWSSFSKIRRGEIVSPFWSIVNWVLSHGAIVFEMLTSLPSFGWKMCAEETVLKHIKHFVMNSRRRVQNWQQVGYLSLPGISLQWIFPERL